MSYCAKCGTTLEENNSFCPSCGTPIAPSASSAPSSPQKGSRPSGITLLTLLEGTVSLFMLLAGVGVIGISIFLGAGGWDFIPEEELAETLQQIPWVSIFTSVQIIAFTSSLLIGIGLVVLILAVIGFIMTWDLWSGKPWARTISMVLAVISILTGVFSLPGSLVSVLINIALLYYLTRPHIRAFYR